VSGASSSGTQRAEVEQVDGPSGERFRRRTDVRHLTRGGEEELRILVQVDKGTLRGRFNRLSEDMVIATPDGEMVGDYTMASEGNDPRRYRFR
jgi:hypothetical protein